MQVKKSSPRLPSWQPSLISFNTPIDSGSCKLYKWWIPIDPVEMVRRLHLQHGQKFWDFHFITVSTNSAKIIYAYNDKNHCKSSNRYHTFHGHWYCPQSSTFDSHDDVIKWKHFPRYCPFVRGIHRSPVNSPHKGQWRGALMFSLICDWLKGWVNNHEAGDLRRHRAHNDVIVMPCVGTVYTRGSDYPNHWGFHTVVHAFILFNK